ncbi:MAG: reverse transcriptase domain-containing protein [Nanoarchaeota archaeon]|nr:reverse transcriptase domain-containing protein [Nanoarchaeota archaeon]
MKTYKNLYEKIISFDNLVLAWKKARKGKTQKLYVVKFEENLEKNLLDLHFDLKEQIYKPIQLETFILRDPKTRKISKSDFRDRILHHAIINILEPIFDKTFIYDSCANRKGKGNLFALKRFNQFKRKVSNNGTKAPNVFNDSNYIKGYCLKADIKHYFEKVDQEILLKLIEKRIKDKNIIWLISLVIKNNTNFETKREGNNLGKGMPLGNLTSQFFANIYLNELDYFIKHELKAKYYIRYVDDFVILHKLKSQLENWKERINSFLKKQLKLEIHPEKSRIIALSRGLDFVGFRNFYHFKLPRKRNIKKMRHKITSFANKEIQYRELMESFNGWQAYAKWGNTFKIRKSIIREIYRVKFNE